jgi:hypothetical protein
MFNFHFNYILDMEKGAIMEDQQYCLNEKSFSETSKTDIAYQTEEIVSTIFDDESCTFER